MDARINDPFFVLFTPDSEWTQAERDEVARRVAANDAIERTESIERAKQAERPACPRCSGRGVMDEYAHVMNGKCFLCGGSGFAD